MIFELWPSPSLPESSPILGCNLSSRPWLLKVCHELWLVSDDVDEYITLEDAQRQTLKSQLVNSPWFNLQFTLELELLLAKDFQVHLPDPEDDIDGVHERMPTARSSFYWDDCDLPPKIIQGPWDTEKISQFILLCQRLNLPINLMRPDVYKAAEQGILNCIKGKNWFILYHLFQLPRYFARSKGIIALDSSLAPVQEMMLCLTDLQREPVPRVDRVPCQPKTFLHVNQDMLRSAVIDNGCDRGIVSLLLLQGLYDLKQVDYLDPILWNWAEQNTRHERQKDENGDKYSEDEDGETDEEDAISLGWTDGVWLKMMLRAVLKVAEHISLPQLPKEVKAHDVFDESYDNFQSRQARLLRQCFLQDIHDYSCVRGNAERCGWWWEHMDNAFTVADNNSRSMFETFWSVRKKAGDKLSLFEHPDLADTVWMNHVFNESHLKAWLDKPYVPGLYFCTEIHMLSALKLAEVLEHTCICNNHSRSRR
jgi:hypothetical protein